MRPSLALSLKQADMSDIKITVDDRGVTEALNQFVARGRDLSPVMKAIAALLQAKAEQNFAAQAGPLGAWPALKKPDKKRKGGMILQDTGPGRVRAVFRCRGRDTRRDNSRIATAPRRARSPP